MAGDEARDEEHQRREEEKEAKRQEQIARDLPKLYKALAKFKDGETKDVLRQRAHLSGAAFNAALAVALEEEEVVECEVVKANRRKPYPGYKLAEDTTHA